MQQVPLTAFSQSVKTR